MIGTPKEILAATAVAVTLSFSFARDAHAGLVLDFTESDGNVILNVSGSLDLVGLTEGNKNASLGAETFLDTVNEQLQLGSGNSAPVNFFPLTVQNTTFSSSTNLFGTSDAWESNTNSIRFQQNNGQVLVDDAIEPGDVIAVTSTHTFNGVTFADFGLTTGDDFVWLENTNAEGDAGQVIVRADAAPTYTFEITAFEYSPSTDEVTVTWRSSPGEEFVVKYSDDMTNWDADLDDGVEGDEGETTTRTFVLQADVDRLYIRVER